MTKNTKDLFKLAIERNPCHLCRRQMRMTCGCGLGGGASSGSSGGSGETNSKGGFDLAPSKTNSDLDSTYTYASPEMPWVASFSSDHPISYVSTLLLIDSDKLRGTLTLRPKPGLSPKELEAVYELLKAIKAVFEAFKKHLQEQGISAKDYTALISKHGLTIHISHPKHYNDFIKLLASKRLLPTPAPTSRATDEQDHRHVSGRNKKPAHLNPFSTRLEKRDR